MVAMIVWSDWLNCGSPWSSGPSSGLFMRATLKTWQKRPRVDKWLIELFPRIAVCLYVNNNVSVKSGSCCYASYKSQADFRFAPSQWETALLCNDVSHWLGATLESALHLIVVAELVLFNIWWFDIFWYWKLYNLHWADLGYMFVVSLSVCGFALQS